MKQTGRLIGFFLSNEVKNRNQIAVSIGIPTLLMVFMGIMGKNQSETQGFGFPYMTYLLPGIVIMSFLATAVITLPVIIVGYREKGIFKRIMITPVSKIKIAAGIFISQLLSMILQAVIITLLAYVFFDVRLAVEGRIILALVPFTFLSMVSLLAMGFMISGFSRNQRTATTLGSTLNLIFPFLSGTYFPIDIWPDIFQPFIRILPTTYIIDALRKCLVFPITNNEYPEIQSFIGPTVVLLALSIIFVVTGLKKFDWK